MDKMRMESIDLTTKNIEKIGELFPNCITETIDKNGKPKKVINFDILKQMLSDDVLEVMKFMNSPGLARKNQLWKQISLLERHFVHVKMNRLIGTILKIYI